LDGSEDDRLWDDSEESDVDYVGSESLDEDSGDEDEVRGVGEDESGRRGRRLSKA